MSIRTRFAPSPTGYLHIGGVRTALFNWLLARGQGGQFILRIDDTDDSRNRAEAVKPIIDGFKWLGMTWDEGPADDAGGDSFGPHKPYFQGQRNGKYEAAAMKLMAEGKAYPDYTTPEQQDAARKQAELARKPYVHRGSNRDVSPEENLQQYQARKVPILLKVIPGQKVTFTDHVRGRIDVSTDTIRDPALLRAPDAKGICRALYSFATVVDEADFGITHVVRAEEHLTNTPTQILIFQALGATPPEFGHVPLIYRNGKKISKRDLPPLSPEEIGKLKACGWTEEEIKGRDDLNLATVAYYRELGYLPEALINYLIRLGWSLDGEQEIIPLDVAIKKFSLDRVTKAPGNFDMQKLFWVQGEYMKLLSTEEKLERCIPFLTKAKLIGDVLDAKTRAILTTIVDASGDRIKLFSDILAYAAPILKDDIEYDPKAREKAFKDANAKSLLAEFAEALKAAEPFDAATIDKVMHQFVADRGLKLNAIQLPTRVAVTGVGVGFGLSDTLAILGKERVLNRVAAALKL
ncbi:glutamate--tRNA ligase [Limnoglobus roseus]|uniref:Glutamate--tRNA ligase n=1 Tax=Limnoglobus roseus TaxID=2598579 RepID=A0A5C1AN55_9BACT|nr:glutamate--tRNA ligase family protein [Limnoglobus roseus]QEL18348.1 glutamate--tRNA ligase [Limnoglobus roseus]